ncbi:MAG: hypothetical protein JZU63_00170 [Rhodoferax sp.]|nr:hypothetical protein [Rhodoferax sp.]
MKIIIFLQDNGGVSVIIPALNCGLTVEQIALKDVPFGKPFKIINASDLPADRASRNAWTVDAADLTDGIGADYGVGSNKPFVMSGAAQ